MSDVPGGPDTPFDSFAGRLEKLKKAVAAPAPKKPPTPETPAAPGASPFDSFSGRLDSALKQTERPPEAAEQNAAPSPPESAAPVGGGGHVVKQGECISSIAENAGHCWETLWDDPANAELRQARRDPNVLLPGDRVHVPPLREKWEPRPTEMRHRFRRRGWPEIFRVRVLRDDEPRGNQPYRLTVDGRETTGTTDANGNVAAPIAPDARRAVLLVGTEPDVDRYEFTLGAIDPIEALSGVQGRLKNLGFDCGPIDGVWGPRSEAALRQYQMKRGLETTGQPDAATRQKLKEDYGS
jgi:Putative peptidoglycan binding domain